jgi:hypothetical protein
MASRPQLAIVVLLAAAALVPPNLVAAQPRSVSYPDPIGDATVDVTASSKAKVLIEGSPTRYRFKVFGNFATDWHVAVYIDAQGGRRDDYMVVNNKLVTGLQGCKGIRLSDGARLELRCGERVVMNDSSAFEGVLWWSIPRPRLAQTKVIRWHVHTHFVVGGSHEGDDDAPDAGRYPR